MVFRDVTLDSEDRVLVDSVSSEKPKRGAFVRLSVPSLSSGSKCEYSWVDDSKTKQHREMTTTSECEASLGASTDFERYFQRERPPFAWPPAVCSGSSAEFCRLPGGVLTSDGKYGVAERRDGHDNLFGNWVTSRFRYVIFSSAKRSDIGEIKLPTDDSTQSRLAYQGGRDYLLLLQDGIRLTVYELRG
jgi:hypothetical protein